MGKCERREPHPGGRQGTDTGYKPRRQTWHILMALRRNQPCPQLDFRLTGFTRWNISAVTATLSVVLHDSSPSKRTRMSWNYTPHSSLHNHTQALRQMIFLGDCNSPLVSPGLSLSSYPPLGQATYENNVSKSLFPSHHFTGRLFRDLPSAWEIWVLQTSSGAAPPMVAVRENMDRERQVCWSGRNKSVPLEQVRSLLTYWTSSISVFSLFFSLYSPVLRCSENLRERLLP